MALTVLIVPMYAPYNQVLMLPAVLALALDRRLLAAGSPSLRWGYMAGTFALAWQWMGSLLLSAAYLFDSSARVIGAWKLPLFATFALPVFVFALILIDVRRVQRQDCLNGR
jgi:hypothetical protein